MLTQDSTPEDVQAAWIAALESGDYTQARHALRDTTGYCCLGVLCDLAVTACVIAQPRATQSAQWEYAKVTDILPIVVKEWAGLTLRDGMHFHDARFTSLAKMNDEGVTFPYIAKRIALQPTGLFIKKELTT